MLAAPGDRAAEARASAQAFLADAGASDVRIHEFRDSFLPYVGGEVKEVFEGLKEVSPTSSSPTLATISTRITVSPASSPGTRFETT